MYFFSFIMPSASCSQNGTFRSILDYSFQFLFSLPVLWWHPAFPVLRCDWIQSNFAARLFFFQAPLLSYLILLFLSAAYFNDCSRTFNFIISHNNAGLTSSSFSYSARHFLECSSLRTFLYRLMKQTRSCKNQ